MARAYGPLQLDERLGLRIWQRDRALKLGLIPPMDRARGWSAALVDQLAARADEIREKVGSIPDMGANRAAVILANRYRTAVSIDVPPELCRRGLLPIVGEYKGYPIYCGRTLETIDLDPELLAHVTAVGRLLTADQAAERLRIRRADLNHLTRAGLLTATSWSRYGGLPKSAAPDVPLYRCGDLDALAADTSIDWAAVRAAAPGTRSPLAALPDGSDQ